MASINEQLLATVQALLRLTIAGRIQWKAPYSALNETVQTSTPRTTFSIAPSILGKGLQVEVFDSEGVKVISQTVNRGNLLGDQVFDLYAAAHSTVFKADKVLENLLDDLGLEEEE
jgi:hypothetical protein